jgi:hypothetical protein
VVEALHQVVHVSAHLLEEGVLGVEAVLEAAAVAVLHDVDVRIAQPLSQVVTLVDMDAMN